MVLLIAAVTALPAMAQSDPQACAAITADTERLACYDALFRAGGEQPTASEPLVVNSERMIPAQPSGRGPATMTVACNAGVLSVMFAFANQPLSQSGDIAPITFQIDQGGTSVRSLAVADDNLSLGYATTAESTAFLDTLAGGTNLKVRITPVRQRPLTVDFRLPAVRDAITALRSACGG